MMSASQGGRRITPSGDGAAGFLHIASLVMQARLHLGSSDVASSEPPPTHHDHTHHPRGGWTRPQPIDTGKGAPDVEIPVKSLIVV